jgi:hypothetical protein
MKNSINPTRDELVEWAYDPESVWPIQDWDLVVTRLDFADTILKLALDYKCPSRIFSFIAFIFLLET